MRPPSVDTLAKSLDHINLPHQLKVEAARRSIANNDFTNVENYAKDLLDDLLQPVINGTGVIIHTNLGRAPLLEDETESQGYRYSNLEFDMKNGKRGSRNLRVGSLISKYLETDSAIVVNNGAAAIFLALATHASDKGVLISRGELVEIGGGFRIPDVLMTSGAKLIEVGTTNKTKLQDYIVAAKNQEVGLILKVHSSNYKMIGFTQNVEVSELKSIGLPVVFDIGSGLLDENVPWLGHPKPSWLKDEPGAKQILHSGADLITFSGDKLFGGPQAGIIAGSKEMVEACAQHPLYRTLRAGALVLEHLQQTMFYYLDNKADMLPIWIMSKVSPAHLERRAKAIGVGTVVSLKSAVGGGSVPGEELASFGISIPGDRTKDLRRLKIPIVARMQGPNTVIDLRTIDPNDDTYLRESLLSLT